MSGFYFMSGILPLPDNILDWCVWLFLVPELSGTALPAIVFLMDGHGDQPAALIMHSSHLFILHGLKAEELEQVLLSRVSCQKGPICHA